MRVGHDGPMDLRTWIAEEHRTLWDRFGDSIVALVPRDRWGEHADGAGSCIGQLVYHVSLHADMALHCVIQAKPPLVIDWRERLGVGSLGAHRGLAESEDAGVVACLDMEALYGYAGAVHEATGAWLASADLARLDARPAASDGLARLGDAGVDAVPWLHRMWSDKPVGWFVQWECTGHVLNHLGEMVSVRNRLGLSPF